MAFSEWGRWPRRTARAIAASRRWPIVSRTLAAAVGGYAIVTLYALAMGVLAPHLGLSRAQALAAALMASFIFYAGLIMAAFHTRTATRAWLGLLLLALPPGVVVLIFP